MPYSHSEPFRRLRSVVGPLKGVARATKTATSRYRQDTNPLREAALSSAVLLGFAAFEDYVKQGVEEIFRLAQANSVEVRRLPSSVRSHVSISVHLKRWGATEPDRLLDQIESERVRGGFIALEDSGLIASRFSTYLLDGVKYPKPQNLRTLFKRMGIPNVYARMDAISRTNTSNLLTSFHDVRASLAHQGMQPGWNADDIASKLDELMIVARCVDRVLWTWTCGHLGASCWPR